MSILGRYHNAAGVVDAPDGYEFVASAGQTIYFDKPTDVAYGGSGSFVYRAQAVGSVVFNNANFGDPAPGLNKAGFKYTGKASAASAQAAQNKIIWAVAGVAFVGLLIGTVFLLRK